MSEFGDLEIFDTFKVKNENRVEEIVDNLVKKQKLLENIIEVKIDEQIG